MATERMTRRKLMTEGPRLALAGVLAGVTGALVMRDNAGVAGPMSEQPCISRGVCRGCGALSRCGLPAALSAKAAGVQA